MNHMPVLALAVYNSWAAHATTVSSSSSNRVKRHGWKSSVFPHAKQACMLAFCIESFSCRPLTISLFYDGIKLWLVETSAAISTNYSIGLEKTKERLK